MKIFGLKLISTEELDRLLNAKALEIARTEGRIRELDSLRKVFDLAPTYRITSRYLLEENKDLYMLQEKAFNDGKLFRLDYGIYWEEQYSSYDRAECEARMQRLNQMETTANHLKNVVLT